MNAPVRIETDAEFRHRVVGASEVAALFDLSPWLTEYELYQRKVGKLATPAFNEIVDGVPVNERAFWGVKLEPMIIQGACERWGYQPLEQIDRIDNGKGLGGHPDKRVICPVRGTRGILEAKMVDWLEVKKWGDEPPLHYLLQNMTYQGLDGCVWGDMIVLVGGNELRRFQYDFRPKLFGEIESRTEAFWDRVRRKDAPKPDYRRDGGVIAEIYSGGAGLTNLTHWNRGVVLAAEYLEAKEREKAAQADAEAAKAELLERMGDHDAATLEGFYLSATTVKGSSYTVERKPYRRFNVKEAA